MDDIRLLGAKVQEGRGLRHKEETDFLGLGGFRVDWRLDSVETASITSA